MLNTPFPPWPAFTLEEADAVRETLLSNRVNYWTGTVCREFEREFADWVGVEYAIALANGTVALETALDALEIGPGDEVVVAPRTFFASASCVVWAGAVPVFADVDRDTQNITAESIAEVLTPRTRAIICVHLAGMPCDMDPIMALARAHNLYVVEDCAQAHGARYKGRSVGSIGDIGAWSFCQDKIMTTGGEGGMVTTTDRRLWSRMWAYKDHGKSWDAMQARKGRQGFGRVHESIGTNGRMTELQATLGRIQLRRMDDWSAARRENAGRIWNECRELVGLRVPAIPEWAEHGAYKCYVFVDPPRMSDGWTRDDILDAVNRRGVPCYHGSCSEVYLEKALRERGLGPRAPLPVAHELGQTSLMLLVHPTLERQHIDLTCEVLREVVDAATAAPLGRTV